MLDDFQVILHSSDSIAPVGILHPLSFHLEKKMDSVSSSNSNRGTSLYLGDISTVYEVLEEQQNCEALSKLIDVTPEKYDAMKENLKISKSRKDDTYSISCWLQQSETSTSKIYIFFVYRECFGSFTFVFPICLILLYLVG